MTSTSLSFPQILEEIHSQIKETPPELLEELMLDSLELNEISKDLSIFLEKCVNLLSLSLNECSLTSLVNLPILPNLVRLELCDNKLPPSSLSLLSQLKNLQALSLGGNYIKSLEDLSPLKAIDSLNDLDLLGCEINMMEDYRDKVFEILPQLQILDNYDREGNDLDEDDIYKEEELQKGRELITKEVIIVDSSDEEPIEVKAPKNAEEYFRKEVFKEKVKGKYETFQLENKKKSRFEEETLFEDKALNSKLKKKIKL